MVMVPVMTVPVMAVPTPVAVMPMAVMPAPVVAVPVMAPAHLFGLEAIDVLLRDDSGLRTLAARWHQRLFC